MGTARSSVRDQETPRLHLTDLTIRFAGTTFGAIVLGAALGDLAGSWGAVIGAVVGAVAAIVVALIDEKNR